MDTKFITYEQFGNPADVLKVQTKRIQPPNESEILVRMLARPINPSDLIPIRGAYSHRISLPQIPGYEGVGIVEDAGSSVYQNLIGKRVLPLRGEGTWQEFVKAPAQFAIPVPDAIDDIIASQLYINPVTAWGICTEELGLKPNDILLVNACGSSIGHIFAQLSKIIGFRLIAVTRNNKHTDNLLRLGASYVINTSQQSLHDTVLELTNGFGANAAIDSVGGASGTDLALSVRPNGTYISIGLLSGVQVSWNEISKAGVIAKMFHLRHWNRRVSLETWQETFHHLITLIKIKKLSLMATNSHYDLLNVKEAVSLAESSTKNKGKVILTS
ncbi:zinc-dependent alcohol dehydrogenase family protein [Paenibacillus sp. GXUN7292]|uniref:zinc-dependent alcohol dehydrogenase family protein n=1 Tax=Paenibacillus sp. GXUN7292 TaxID=3422499 RepID=UPI003D7DB3E5